MSTSISISMSAFHHATHPNRGTIPAVVYAGASCQGVSLMQGCKVTVVSLQIVDPDTDRNCGAYPRIHSFFLHDSEAQLHHTMLGLVICPSRSLSLWSIDQHQVSRRSLFHPSVRRPVPPSINECENELSDRLRLPSRRPTATSKLLELGIILH